MHAIVSKFCMHNASHTLMLQEERDSTHLSASMPLASNGDCIAEYLRWADGEWARIRSMRKAIRIFDLNEFHPASSAPCVIAPQLTISVARTLARSMRFGSQPFAAVPSHFVFHGSVAHDPSSTGAAIATMRRLDDAFCSTTSDGTDRRIDQMQHWSPLARRFYQSELLTEMAFDYLARHNPPASSEGSSKSLNSSSLKSLCMGDAYGCTGRFKWGGRISRTVGGITPRHASPGTGWHADPGTIGMDRSNWPRLKSMMYLSNVSSDADAALTMMLEYEPQDVPGWRCRVTGVGRCRWPACGDAIRAGNRFSDEAVEKYLAAEKAFAVEIRGPAGTILLFDGHNVHRSKVSTTDAVRYTLTNYHDTTLPRAPLVDTNTGGVGSGSEHSSAKGDALGRSDQRAKTVQSSERREACLQSRAEGRRQPWNSLDLRPRQCTPSDRKIWQTRADGHCGNYELAHEVVIGSTCRAALGECLPHARWQQSLLFCKSARSWWNQNQEF